MRRSFVIATLLLFVWSAVAWGAEPAPSAVPGDSVAAPVSGEPGKPLLPECKLTFQTLEEPLPVPVEPDPKLLEQRYVATFTIEIPRDSYAQDALGDLFVKDALNDAMRQRDRPLVSSKNAIGVAMVLFHGARTSPLDQETYEFLLGHAPKDRRPSKRQLDALSRPLFQMSRRGTSADHHRFSYRVFAATSQDAEQSVRALVDLYAYGLSYRMQEHNSQEQRTTAENLARAQEELEKSGKEVAECDKQLKTLEPYNDITKEAMANCRLQQRMLDVDVAGVKGRLAACNDILKKFHGVRVEQVETLKVTAEIELVGLEARRAALGEIVKQAEQRLTLLDRRNALRFQQSRLKNAINDFNTQIARYVALRIAWSECPVVDGKVTIQPIKWEAGKK